MGAASFKTCLTSALKILDREAAFMNAEGASFAAETLAEMPGTRIPRENSTARTVCTKFTWTKEYNQYGRWERSRTKGDHTSTKSRRLVGIHYGLIHRFNGSNSREVGIKMGKCCHDGRPNKRPVIICRCLGVIVYKKRNYF